MFGRNLRTGLDQIQPDVSARVEKQQLRQKKVHDSHARNRSFEVHELVFVCNFHTGQPWPSGQGVRVLGPVSFEVELTNGQIVRRHQDHIRKRPEMTDSSEGDFVTEHMASESLLGAPEVVVTEDAAVAPALTLNPETPLTTLDSAASSSGTASTSVTTVPTDNSTAVPVSASSRHRYPSRSRVPPDHYRY